MAARWWAIRPPAGNSWKPCCMLMPVTSWRSQLWPVGELMGAMPFKHGLHGVETSETEALKRWGKKSMVQLHAESEPRWVIWMSFWIRWRLCLIVTWWCTLIPVVNMPNLVFPLALSFWAIAPFRKETPEQPMRSIEFSKIDRQEKWLFLSNWPLNTKSREVWDVISPTSSLILNQNQPVPGVSKELGARTSGECHGKASHLWQGTAMRIHFKMVGDLTAFLQLKSKIKQTYHIGWWFIALNPSTVGMDSKNGAIKLIKCLVEIETLPWFVKPDWNAGLETSQLFIMNMRGNSVLVVSHLVPYLKSWNILKSTQISLLTNFFMVLKMMQFSSQLLKCLIHFIIFFWCWFLAHLELQWLGWIHGRMRRQPKKSRSTAIPHHGVHIVTRPTLRRDLKFKDQLLILDSV